MPSFDIVSEPNMHEVKNACDQVERELVQRYDFRGTDSILKTRDGGFDLSANSEERVKAILEVLKEKFIKRKLSLKYLDCKNAVGAGGNIFRLSVDLKKGIDKENAKILVSKIKSQKNLKVTPSIQGDAVRVAGKKRDDLQDVMALFREEEQPLELSFINFRD